MSNATMPEIPEAHLVGRPPKAQRVAGAKRGPKPRNGSVPTSMTQYLPSYLTKPAAIPVPAVAVPVVAEPEPIIKDGFPNLPECKLIGRPEGSKNTSPRQRRTPAAPAAEAPAEAK